MSSFRRRLAVNVNNSKNTRLDIGGAGMIGDWRADTLAHISRYGRIAKLLIDESRRLGRPLRCLEIGCGEFWAMKALFHAYQVRKADVIAEYVGVDIDPAVQLSFDALGAMTTTMAMRLQVQDLTTTPDVALDAVDVCWSTEVIEHMRPTFVPAWLDAVDRALTPGALIYISTPNRDGSHERLPKDHVYEWGFDELKTELTKRWILESTVGTFIQMPHFLRANKQYQRIPDALVTILHDRFDAHWIRVMLAAPYPEVSNNVAWRLRKPSNTPKTT